MIEKSCLLCTYMDVRTADDNSTIKICNLTDEELENLDICPDFEEDEIEFEEELEEEGDFDYDGDYDDEE